MFYCLPGPPTKSELSLFLIYPISILPFFITTFPQFCNHQSFLPIFFAKRPWQLFSHSIRYLLSCLWASFFFISSSSIINLSISLIIYISLLAFRFFYSIPAFLSLSPSVSCIIYFLSIFLQTLSLSLQLLLLIYSSLSQMFTSHHLQYFLLFPSPHFRSIHNHSL